MIDRTERQLDVVVAEAKDADEPPGARTISAIGEASKPPARTSVPATEPATWANG
ncbi:hypothetical protein [Kribbella albertanoniae]|uniref:hypothetical protein n=1 Tax=Kribbella albertanoniae TaxID=1266829 RepID=UPI001404857D|nr:hypothetical protein [Kribbella albertanoniae]